MLTTLINGAIKYGPKVLEIGAKGLIMAFVGGCAMKGADHAIGYTKSCEELAYEVEKDQQKKNSWF